MTLNPDWNNFNFKALAITCAIAHMEGFYQTVQGGKTLAFRNKNPGNIRQWEGMPAGQGGYCACPTIADGFRILYEDVLLNSGKRTLAEFIARYAPPSDNNQTSVYLAFVSEHSGVGPDEMF